MAQPEVKTLTVDNWGGRRGQYFFGDINSGMVPPYPGLTFGSDPFITPGRLTWVEQPTQIDPNGTVITDLVMAGKERIEGNITYVYAIGHTGRVYKIQVNDPSSFNPDYDNPVLLTTLTVNSPTFTRGGSVDFFGSTEKLYIGHDKGLTTLNFDGTGEAFVGVLGSWTQTVPRPLKQFAGSLLVGNGTNLAQVDSTATVVSYSKFSPGFPIGTQVRDLDISNDGNYLQTVVTRLSLPDMTSTTQDDKFLGSTESYIFWWNGSDVGYTSYQIYPSFSLNANHTYANKQYVFGYDISGGAIFNPTEKILTQFLSKSPMPNAVGSNANHIGWMVPEWVGGFTKSSFSIFGALDMFVKEGWWRYFDLAAKSPETDVICNPFMIIVSGLVFGSSTNGYASGIASTGKIYFSALEASSAPTTAYRFYRWRPLYLTGISTPIQGIYQTQVQLLSKKVKISQVRVYTNDIVANNSFQIGIIDPGGSSTGTTVSGSTKVFTAGSTMAVGDNLMQYKPEIKPIYGIGLQIVNLGTVNMTINKVEIDYSDGGI